MARVGGAGGGPLAHMLCTGCSTLLVYPMGAQNVRCALCGCITPVHPYTHARSQQQMQQHFAQHSSIVQLQCAGCRSRLMYRAGASQVQCALCNTLNRPDAPVMDQNRLRSQYNSRSSPNSPPHNTILSQHQHSHSQAHSMRHRLERFVIYTVFSLLFVYSFADPCLLGRRMGEIMLLLARLTMSERLVSIVRCVLLQMKAKEQMHLSTSHATVVAAFCNSHRLRTVCSALRACMLLLLGKGMLLYLYKTHRPLTARATRSMATLPWACALGDTDCIDPFSFHSVNTSYG